jgi:hypothetical protein
MLLGALNMQQFELEQLNMQLLVNVINVAGT